MEQLAAPGHAVTRAERYRTVTAEGRFDTDDEVVVRRRTNADDRVGFHVLTPRPRRRRVLLVNRGCSPAERAGPRSPSSRAAARRDHDQGPADARLDDRGERHQRTIGLPYRRSC
ncbi:hypothetical protein GCM10023238_02060 [Streptomyces heliomycini]